MKSKFLNLSASDFYKGLLVAVITAFLTGLYQLIQNGADLTWVQLKPVLLATVGAGISYLLKNLFSNSSGEFAKGEGEGGSRRRSAAARILILAVFLSGIGITASGQMVPRGIAPEQEKASPWNGFFRPVDDNMFSVKGVSGTGSSVWLFRPSVQISALQLIPSDVEGKVFDVSSFQSLGIGVGYQHFTTYNGEPFSDYGFNALLLFDAIPRETTDLNVSAAVTISALQFMNFGGGYNIGLKKFFILAGISYNFN